MRPLDSDDRAAIERDLADRLEADRHARLLDAIYIDAELLDAAACPPDRRFYRGGREAWVYQHDNICELVFVRSLQE